MPQATFVLKEPKSQEPTLIYPSLTFVADQRFCTSFWPCLLIKAFFD
jgi:hypothetical protein